MKFTPLTILVLVFAACNNQKPAETLDAQPPQDVTFYTVDSVTKSFMLPDSINSGLIIATYVEIDPESHTLLMYTNNDKKKAKQIRYLNDGSVSVDLLDVISETELKSPLNKYRYLITDSTVVFKQENGHFQEHYRTDANN
jgi:hypothetical protein